MNASSPPPDCQAAHGQKESTPADQDGHTRCQPGRKHIRTLAGLSGKVAQQGKVRSVSCSPPSSHFLSAGRVCPSPGQLGSRWSRLPSMGTRFTMLSSPLQKGISAGREQLVERAGKRAAEWRTPDPRPPSLCFWERVVFGKNVISPLPSQHAPEPVQQLLLGISLLLSQPSIAGDLLIF